MFLKIVFKKRNGKEEKNNFKTGCIPNIFKNIFTKYFYRNNCFSVNIVHEITWLKQLQQMFHCFILLGYWFQSAVLLLPK